MSGAISTSLSGLAAATTRINAIAANVANAGNVSRLRPAADDPPPFQPVDTVQVALPDGGTQASVQPVRPASLPSSSPDSPEADADGLVATPNVDLDQQMTDLLSARQAYEANIATLRAAQDMQRRVLDAVS